MKAHELRFFIQDGTPYGTKNIVPEWFHTILCLSSSVKWLATKDSMIEKEISTVEKLCDVFVCKFEHYFGEEEMKFFMHLMQHLGYTLRLHGLLRNVPCYGPENEIGKIGRRVCAFDNTTNNIINDFRTLSEYLIKYG